MFKNKETHPSYATLQFNRTSGGSKALFGSSIKHRDTIVMRVRAASIDRYLNQDWITGEDEIIECEMSYSQFAEVITSMNQGTGVPVTLRRLQGKKIEECPFVDKKIQFEEEFSNKLKKQNEKANELIEKVSNLFSEKKTLNKADKESILSMLNMLKTEIGSNQEFTYSQFNEQMDKTTREAKGEIEAFMQNKINSLASSKLVEIRDDVKKLNSPIEY